MVPGEFIRDVATIFDAKYIFEVGISLKRFSLSTIFD